MSWLGRCSVLPVPNRKRCKTHDDRIRSASAGATKNPHPAFQKKAEVDANFVKLMKMLLMSGTYHGIATHDPAMIDATKQFARDQNIDPHSFEFQMLYGVRRDLQQQLVQDGWRMRVYIPFGTEWYHTSSPGRTACQRLFISPSSEVKHLDLQPLLSTSEGVQCGR